VGKEGALCKGVRLGKPGVAGVPGAFVVTGAAAPSGKPGRPGA